MKRLLGDGMPDGDELREEMEAHIAHRVDELVAGGCAPDAAERRARREFGNLERIARQVDRESGSGRRRRALAAALDGVRQDLLFALRQVRRAPGFAGLALAILVLGVGSAVAIGTVVRAVSLEPLPYDDPGELVELHMWTPEHMSFSVSEPAFLEWRRELTLLDGVAAFATRGAILRAPGTPRSIPRGYLSAGMLEVLGATPLMGREFTADEDHPEAPAPVALVSEAFWRNVLAAPSSLDGVEVDLDGVRHAVVGVAPATLALFTGDAPVFTPLSADPAMDRGEHYLTVVGRLGDGVDLEAARREFDERVALQSATYEADRGWSGAMVPLKESLLGVRTLQAGWVLVGAAGLLLLMAAVNVSNLLLARATTRSRELGVRSALGAGRGRLLRQLYVEVGVLAAAGGGLGVALAAAVLPVVRELGAGRVPRLERAVLDPQAVLLALLLTGATLALVAWVPALSVRRARPALAGGVRGRDAGRGALRRILVAAQFGGGMVLLVASGLLMRTFVSLSTAELGYEARGRYTVSLSMPDQTYPWTERADLVAAIEARVAALPGVTAVGSNAVVPFSGANLANNVARLDRLPERSRDFPGVYWRVATPGWFDAAGVTIVAGRPFADADYTEGAPAPVVVDRVLAEQLWGDAGRAVGETLVWGHLGGSHLEVTGVVEPVRDVDLTDAPTPMIYRLHRQIPWAVMGLVVATERAGPEFGRSIRAAVAEAAPGLPVPEVEPLGDAVRGALAQPRFNLILMATFALLGLTLSLMGLYAVTAYEVRQRYREIGIRLSLGARPASIRRTVLLGGVRLVLAGTALGVGLLVWLAPTVDGLLHGVSFFDPITWVGSVAVLVAMTLLAGEVPARRATRVDPRSVIQGE